MNDKLDNLLRILFDETARLDEKDDAIIYLGPPALTALTLLIAESSPKEKDRIIGLVCTILKKRK